MLLFQISRGSADSRKQTSTNMKNHLDRKHSKELKDIATRQSSTQEPTATPSSQATNDSASTSDTRKRGSANYTELLDLCPQKRRNELFQSTIDDWVEAKTMLPFDHPRALRLNKFIFEMLMMDNLPFYEVMKPGL